MAKLQNNNYIRYFSSKQISTPPKKKEGIKPPLKHHSSRPYTPYLYADNNSPVRHTKAPKTPLKRPHTAPRPPPM